MRTALSGNRLCIGLLSGTSADAIDAALVRIRGAGPEAQLHLLAYRARPFPPLVRRELFQLFEQAPPALERLCTLHVILGELFAEAAMTLCRAAGCSLDEVFVIGSHGQTVWHQPAPSSLLPLAARGTLQIGDPAVIAQRTGVPVVADFRAADMAAGGQGAPLTPYLDWVVLRHPTRHRAIQNIGGIGNVTYLPASAPREDVFAFDTGPGNMVIDGVVQLLTTGELDCDRNGALAAQGRVDRVLLERLLADPFLDQPPPKTTGRERYGLPFARQLLNEFDLPAGILHDPHVPATLRQRACDLVATVTAFTAHAIAESYRRWLPPIDEVVVSGGGARNPSLMRVLRDLLAPVPVVPAEALGLDSAAKEAMLFALLAHEACFGLPTNVPSATGARHAVTLGSLTPPNGWKERANREEEQP